MTPELLGVLLDLAERIGLAAPYLSTIAAAALAYIAVVALGRIRRPPRGSSPGGDLHRAAPLG